MTKGENKMEDLLTLTHLGDDYNKYLNAVVPPVFLTSLHVFDTIEDFLNYDNDNKESFIYARNANPTVQLLEQKVAELERGYQGIAFASGMAASTAAILSTCKAGSHVICIRNSYGPVKKILEEVLVPKFDMSLSYWTGEDLDELENLIQDNTALIIIESPSTFVFSIMDIEGVAKIAKEHGVKTFIDNTNCSPLYQKPLDMGIDIVMHTLSKYISGHSDVVGGILIGKDPELCKSIQLVTRELFGGILGPMEAWLAVRGLRTLDARLSKHQETAMKVATFLEQHPRVKKVYYTGLASHPQAELIAKQQKGHTGLLSFVLKDEPEAALEVINKLKWFKIGCSWGGFESLVLSPIYNMTDEQIGALGLLPQDRGLIRIHCGLEGSENLIGDLENALK